VFKKIKKRLEKYKKIVDKYDESALKGVLIKVTSVLALDLKRLKGTF